MSWLFEPYVPPLWEVWVWEIQMAIGFTLSIVNLYLYARLRGYNQKAIK